ncbi:hypothetical protein DH09_21505 [Bacillaceae bacterium JMAK1]|nr:hypothetical protein DH09_21505 [Bacillaceae bacterium JMAK1]
MTKEPKKKKPLYARWWFIAIVAIFLISIVVPSDDSEDVASDDTEDDNIAGAEEVDNKDTEIDAAEESTTNEAIQEEEIEVEETVGVGETLELGDAHFTVHNVETGVTEVGNEFLNETTSGQFVLLDLTFQNEGNDSVTTDTSFFKLVSDERTYDADSMASMYANDEGSSFFLESVNPGMDRRGIVVFETPADADDFILEVQTGFWGTEKGQITLQ